MEINDLLIEVKVPTFELRAEVLQKLLLYNQKKCKSSDIDTVIRDEILEELWSHLQGKLHNFDDQLLCATCFYTILIHSEKQEYYLQNILKLVANDAENKREIVISFMYGLYQSPFLSVKNPDTITVCPLLVSMFDLLLKMGYIYSKYTFIVFKTISSLKKLCGTNLQEIVLHENNQIKLLNLLSHNWENPITGVRDLIKDIFQTLLTILKESTYVILLREIREYYWNKAKYLMLSKVSEVNRSGTEKVIDKNHLVEGLMKSLHKTGLVSAGADLYYAVLKNINNESEWCDVFLRDVICIFSSLSTNKAIENFNNYWLLVTLKKFPSLFQIILIELVKMQDSPQKLFGTLFIAKQANKLGLLDKDFDKPSDDLIRLIFNGLQSSDTHVRMLTFDIVCISNKKSMPTTTEYNLILDFIHYNINTDCSVLRINMLNSLTIFLTQLHISFVNLLKTEEEEQNMLYFCLKFQEIVITSLNMNGNYQRKITCIKLIIIFLTSLSEIPQKRKKQTKRSISTVIDMLKSKNILKLLSDTNFNTILRLLHDPSEDIRDNVINLLLSHFYKNIREINLIENLMITAKMKNASKFFYDINCGQSIYKLVTNIILKDKLQEIKFKSVEDMFGFAYDELIAEYNLQRDIVDSIANGKQLHALISTLYTILKASYQNGYAISISQEKMITLLNALEVIANQFVWESENSTSSDFSQISEKIEDMVKKSKYSVNINKEQTKLSGLHQIVLNCLWLNVKESCDLAALLIQHKMEIRYQVEVCEKSLNIIVRVLETCRHKGAIEAAGVALGQSIHHLTSLPENSELSKLPYLLLEKKLTQMISEAGKMASITRRGAGLSIMFHRIVANDMKKEKFLFHYFMKTLLGACKKKEDFPDTQESSDMDNEKDLPKAIFIHLLTRIVTDSSLASDTMYYAPELAELAFSNLINKYWQIRNAALQLYGSLVPKLIGQKKQSGTENETVTTVACDELRTHFPKMWDYMITKLQNIDESDKLQCHSNLVPILNILANMAPRYNYSWDMEKEKDKILLNSLFLILDSPIYTVRRLTVKCIFNIFDFKMVYQSLMFKNSVSENFLHGCLMLLSCYKSDKNCVVNFEALKLRFSSVFSEKRHSYLCKTLFDDLFSDDIDLSLEKLKQMVLESTQNTYSPGAHLWKRRHLEYYLTYVSWKQIPDIVNVLIQNNDIEYCCKILLQKCDSEKSDDDTITESMTKIAKFLINFEQKFDSSIVWELLYKISLKVSLDSLSTSAILYYFQSNNVTYKLRYMIPLIVRLLSTKQDIYGNLIKISKIIYTLTDAATTDIEMRHISATANNEIGKVFHRVPDCVKITAIKSAVVLLQDEDSEIRNLSIEFYESISKEEIAPHSYVCFQRILDRSFLKTLLSEELIRDLTSDLEELSTKLSEKPKIDEFNPFSNDSKNIYLEVNVFKKLVNDLKT